MHRQESSLKSQRQRGAVMILFAVSLTVLLGFMALVIDLGRTYVVRTELQNAADAAALAGAKDLNQTVAGVTSAVATAIAMAGKNNYKFSSPVVITIANISVGSCPDDSCMVLASTVASNALAAGKTFLKVDIPTVTLTTFVANLIGFASTSTFGRAVAGYFVVDITPMGVCAIDASKPGGRRPLTPPVADDELTEYGFRRGVSYNLMQLGDVAGSSTPYLINPVDVFSSGGPCSNSNSSAATAAPYICTGTSTVAVKIPGFVYGSTGFQAGPVEKALNSRFDDYTGNTCDPASAPPDINMTAYTVPSGNGAGPSGNPRDWMQPGASTLPANSKQSISIDTNTHKPFDFGAHVPAITAADYGALWTYSRAIKATGTSPNAKAATGVNANFTLSDWSSLYTGNTADQTATGYPASPSIPPFPVGSLAAPYNTPTGNKYNPTAPSHTGKRDRRVIQVVIVDCANSSGNNCGSSIKILNVGRFFLTTKANLPSTLNAEFDGLLDPIPPTEIRLYK